MWPFKVGSLKENQTFWVRGYISTFGMWIEIGRTYQHYKTVWSKVICIFRKSQNGKKILQKCIFLNIPRLLLIQKSQKVKKIRKKLEIHKFFYFLLKFYMIFQQCKKSCVYSEDELKIITMFDFSASCTKVQTFSAITSAF